MPDAGFQHNTLSLFLDTICRALYLYLTAFVVILPLILWIFSAWSTLLVVAAQFVTISGSQSHSYNQCLKDPYCDFGFFLDLHRRGFSHVLSVLLHSIYLVLLKAESLFTSMKEAHTIIFLVHSPVFLISFSI